VFSQLATKDKKHKTQDKNTISLGTVPKVMNKSVLIENLEFKVKKDIITPKTKNLKHKI